MLRVTSGAQVLGYLYNFRHHDHVIAYQSGFDYAAAAALAVLTPNQSELSLRRDYARPG
jgi:prephenate dehydrogenase